MDNLEVLHDRYGSALFLAAEQKNDLGQVMEGLEVLNEEWIRQSEFRQLMLHPLVTKDEKKRVVEQLAQNNKFSKTILDFLRILIDNKREGLIHGVYLAYRDRYEASKNKIWVEVESPRPLSEEEKFLLKDVLTLKFRGEIQLGLKENSSLIGGLYLRYRDNIYDSSLEGKLRKLKEALCPG